MEFLRIVGRSLAEGFPPAPTFDPKDIPDLTGKVIIVTGANTGIGKETAKALLNRNAKVYFAGRSKEKNEAAIQQLKAETGREGIFLELDLADLNSVKKAAEEFRSKEQDLHVLINNAGVFACPIDWTTNQGYDMQFGTNVVGHFYFTKLLLPNLLATAKKDPSGHSRVVHVSSSASYFVKCLDFNTFRDGPARVKLGTHLLYFQSKLANAIVSNEFARRYGDQGLVSISLNPGNLKTDLARHISAFYKWFSLFWLYPSHLGALTQLWAATMDEAAKANGKFLIPWARIGEQPPGAKNDTLGKELWAWLEEQVADI